MFENKFSRDDLIPMLRDAGIGVTLNPWLKKVNASEEFIIELIRLSHGVDLTVNQTRQLISDLLNVNALEDVNTNITLPIPITRPAAPSGLGCAHGGNLWCTPPDGDYTLRWYVNGNHILTMHNYNTTDLASVGAVPGDIAQVCQVSDSGAVGWFARIVVP